LVLVFVVIVPIYLGFQISILPHVALLPHQIQLNCMFLLYFVVIQVPGLLNGEP